MKKYIKALLIAATGFVVISCDSYLDTPSYKIIEPEAVWKDPKLINGVLVNLYDNMQVEHFNYWFNEAWRLQNPTSMSDEAQASFQKDRLWDNGNATYTYEDNLFDHFSQVYQGIYNCNNFLEQIGTSSLAETDREALKGEVRFIRAWHYFSLVKRYGGLPLITSLQQYKGPESIEVLQLPRNKEHELYDFIISEMKDVADKLPNKRSNAELYRITSGAAWALCSRAALYAGSIAKYGTLNNTNYPEYDWIVGISPEKASGYFQAAYEASQKVINQNVYKLADDYETMFTNTVNGSNGEYIFQRQFNVAGAKGHDWDKRNAPFSYRNGGWGCGMAPTLEMVESYEYTDGSKGTLQIFEADGVTPKRFENPYDIFKDKDPRLFSSVYLPGSPCKGSNIEIRRGIINSNGQEIPAANQPGDKNDDYKDPTGTIYKLSGKDGFSNVGDQTKTGFYQKKFFDETLMNVDMGKSQTPWCIFRLAEMYLNLAEAAQESGNTQAALDAINTIRAKRGMSSLQSINLEKVRHERKVELAFEGHRFWDMKRWRIAHLDVSEGGLNGFKGTALCPWYDVRDGKYIFKKDPNTPKQTRIFLKKNYYTKISTSDINSNPKMRQNPEYTN